MDDQFDMEEEEEIVIDSEHVDHNKDDFLVGRSISIDNSILDSSSSTISSVQVEAFLQEDNFHDENDFSKEIIVQKINDLIDENQFNELSVIVTNPEELDNTELDGRNITIIPRNVSTDPLRETLVISDEEEVGVITSDFFDNSRYKQVSVIHEYRSVNEDENKSPYSVQKAKVKNKAADSDPLTTKSHKSYKKHYKDSSLPKEHSYQWRRSNAIKVDKNDPRCRLHFVKFMKKDGKTIKIWECGICGKEFIHQYTLLRHLPIHTDERNYKCKVCGKAFKQLSTLAQHKVIHTEHRPYVCDICQKTFMRVSTLLSHKKIHADFKCHKCDICGKSFHQKVNLKNHYFTHTNARPYKCDLCGRGFNQASNLRCHKSKAHSGGNGGPIVINNRFKCSVCSQTYARKALLRQHEDYVHGIKSVVTAKNSLKQELIPGKNSVLRKKKIGNIRIIQLPTNETIKHESKTGILIDPIDTKAMHKALSKGVTPFALLKPIKSSPVVVKVQLCNASKHMLVPASAAELRAAGKFTVVGHQDGKKAVHIKVPVVATVHQMTDKKGEVHMNIEPPSDEESDTEIPPTSQSVPPDSATQETQNYNQHSLLVLPPVISSSVNCTSTTLTQHFVLNPSVVKTTDKESSLLTNDTEEIYLNVLDSSSDGAEYILPAEGASEIVERDSHEVTSSVDLLATAVNLATANHMKVGNLVDPSGETRYLRPTENYGEYEVVKPEEATHFTVPEGVIQKLKPILDENTPVTVDQSHLSALMDVLKNAGYELRTSSEQDDDSTHQIILNSVDDSIIDNQPVQMLISDNEGQII